MNIINFFYSNIVLDLHYAIDTCQLSINPKYKYVIFIPMQYEYVILYSYDYLILGQILFIGLTLIHTTTQNLMKLNEFIGEENMVI